MCHSEGKCQSFHQRVGSPEQPGAESGSSHSEQGQAWHVAPALPPSLALLPNGEGRGEGAIALVSDCDPSARTGSHEGQSVTNPEKGPVKMPEHASLDADAKLSTLGDELELRAKTIQQELDALVSCLKRDVANLASVTQEAHAPRSKSTSATGQSNSQLDLLEIYCEENSRLTEVALRLGLKARRFTRADGDLRTEEGRNALWRLLVQERPGQLQSTEYVPEFLHTSQDFGSQSRTTKPPSIMSGSL
eukprot:s759_g13.t1